MTDNDDELLLAYYPEESALPFPKEQNYHSIQTLEAVPVRNNGYFYLKVSGRMFYLKVLN